MTVFSDFNRQQIANDYLQQGVTIKRQNFSKPQFLGKFDGFFENRDVLFINRNHLFEAFSESKHEGILKTLMWGFPTGGRGFLLQKVLESIEFFERCISLCSSVTEENFHDINSISGVKFATTTKFLYFSRAKIDGMNCLIFDARVKNFIQRNNYAEFFGLKEIFNAGSYGISFAEYSSYVLAMHKLANQLYVTPDELELYFFSNVPGMRPPSHIIQKE
jgi:hypothetical protein